MELLKRQDCPNYSVVDYEAWQGNWELIQGIPYAMSPAPSIAHQEISSKIHANLFNGLAKCKNCQALLPVDWKISDGTVVQPDNIVVCTEVSGQYLTQAPAIVFEVLSPSTAKKDEGIKFELYQLEGVKYYIMVNLSTSVAKVFHLTDDGRLVKKKDAKNETMLFSIEGCELKFDFLKIW